MPCSMIGSKMPLPVSNPVVVILGPTAVGKTAFSIKLAQHFDGEIISVDSRYLYRGMDVGTAKPTPAERKGIPHFMIDVVDPDESISMAVFQSDVYQYIDEIHQRKKIPFLVGGTGQYLWSVVEGWQPPRTKPNTRLREVLENLSAEIGAVDLFHYVELIDPKAAEKIEANNVRRSIRALEVIFSSGELFSKQKEKNPPPYNFKIIGLNRPRSDLYQRVDLRIEKMLEQGFLEEVKKLAAKGYDPTLPSMSAIGYKEIRAYLNQELSMEEAVVLIKRRTRNFIRHQANWFKLTDKRIHWFDVADTDIEDLIEFISSNDGWERETEQ